MYLLLSSVTSAAERKMCLQILDARLGCGGGSPWSIDLPAGGFLGATLGTRACGNGQREKLALSTAATQASARPQELRSRAGSTELLRIRAESLGHPGRA